MTLLKKTISFSACEQGYWGPGCLFTCAAICTPPGASGACNFITGAPCQCVAGYEGDHCTSRSPFFLVIDVSTHYAHYACA